jgi:cytochrome c-type biogenesis protein CcmH/NrfG
MKNLFVRWTLPAALSALALAAGAFAQNSISGIVVDANRRPVAELEVELLDEFERLLRTTRTKGSGLYIFQGLRGGIYYIQVQSGGSGYRTVKERVQLGQSNRTNRTSGAVTGSEALQVNLTVEPDSRRPEQLTNEVVFAQSVPAEAEKQYREALKNSDQKKRAETVAALEKAIEIFPDYYLALQSLGGEYLAQNKFAEAAEIFRRALAVNPKSFSCQYGLAAAEYSLKKWAEAARALAAAIELNASSVNSYYLLGKIQRETREYERAEINLKKADQLADRKLPEIHWELALLYYYNLDRPAEAADRLVLYLKTKPKAENREQIEKLIRTMREKAAQKK